MSTFAAKFRELVGPRLRRECYVHGVLVGLGLEDWADAHSGIVREGLRLGAGHLPRDLFDDLVDQLATWLVEEASRVQDLFEVALEERRRAA